MKEDNDRKQATLDRDDGENYQKISMIMTEMGYKMNQVSARNYVNRIMKKFVEALIDEYDIIVSDDRAESIARSSEFQMAMFEVLEAIEGERRRSQ
jgi:transposase